MEYNHKFDDIEWVNAGSEPSKSLQSSGFQAGYKPSAGLFNWFWSKVMKAITEIQAKLTTSDDTANNHIKNKTNPHGVTAEQVGARPNEKPNIVVNAVREETSEGKEIYVVTDSNITELYNGLEITIIPNAKNTTSTPRLKINDFGDNGIRLPLSFNCAATDIVKANFFQLDRPITLKYHSELNLGIQGKGAWLFADRIKTSAQDLYGDVPIESGGTGAETAEEARKNLGVAPAVEDKSYSGCYYRTVDDEIEWINPPMIEDEEYRTTERFKEKPVYAKLGDIGDVGEALSSQEFGTGVILQGLTEVVNITGSYKQNDTFRTVGNGGINAYINSFNAIILTFSEKAEYTDIFVTVKYIKE